MTTLDSNPSAALSCQAPPACDLSESVLTEDVLADVLLQADLLSVRDLERARAKQARTGFSLRDVILPAIPWGRILQKLNAEVRLSETASASLGDVLAAAHWLSHEQLVEARRDQCQADKALARILLTHGVLTPTQLTAAAKYQKQTGVSLWRTLINLDYALPVEITRAFQIYNQFPLLAEADHDLAHRLLQKQLIAPDVADALVAECEETWTPLSTLLSTRGLVSEESLARTVAEQFGLTFVTPPTPTLDPDDITEFPAPVQVKCQAVPIARRGRELTVMLADPTRIPQIEELAETLDLDLVPVLTTASVIQQALQTWVIGDTARLAPDDEPGRVLLAARAQVADDRPEEGSVTALTDAVLAGAVNARATDVHLESQERGLRVRYRIDGFLHDIMNLPRAVGTSVVSRLKVMSNLDIAERRRSQDGHITFHADDNAVDMRISTVPGYLGESAVIRIITERTVVTGLSQLGLDPAQRSRLDTLLSRPYGMILAAGPVGSGKTTTMYACLNQVNILSRNVMTIEDPVEYRLKGTNQLQVDYRRGFDFAAGLRAILRQDPDTIMVGEIRDNETARTAVRAAMTGILVLSTVHGNDAPSTASSLYQYDTPSFLISNALVGVIAQRLVRRICPHCRTAYSPGPQIYKQLGLDPDQHKDVPLYRGRGCAHCLHTGYSGRTGVYEVMEVVDELKDLIARETTKEAIYRAAVELGMQPLKQSGINKVLAGETTVDEFFRVIFT